ncbi:hypothetical protein PBT90_10075 [Algoriphagus halophytocola]|uniref:Peptidase M10 metallopeptidase domain-containing protein n=1 Tax=Algoriphagus halophytocola TaxID=2991499 RepID=A0ABY6MIW6_9BACT|nr:MULTISPECIES: hypothetical protein [unclassified Algoriphagus]UZD23735.1 hypothetical protein OM944_04405 [Algoriphagus sp. TR-M5]WBL45029.1 hypothetical protein PBT90_10075 [Algoriphagus sp. TR-M9]
MKNLKFPALALLGLAVVSCQNMDQEKEVLDQEMEHQEVVYKSLEWEPVEVKHISPNARTATSSYSLELVSAEYITAPESEQMGHTVIFNDRGNKQLDFDFSPLAKLNGISDISYYVDQTRPGTDLDQVTKEAAIDRAAMTWDAVSCSDFGLYKEEGLPVPIGIVAAQLGFPSIAVYIADINHAGWMPAEFFDAVAPGGSESILGVTFTLLLVDENGEYVDTNGDGKLDVGLREIYYNDNFFWGDGELVDVESIALHEMGHGLSQGHFGKGFIKKNGSIQFAPKAVMNAAYVGGVETDIKGTDNGGHCSIWSDWPNQ